MEQVNTRLKQMDGIGEYKFIKQMDRIGKYKVIKQIDGIGKYKIETDGQNR